ncbi:MAG: dihydrodipicolinate synthase family protein [Panacagrimonas sp.]|nr:dihydrodipicolinate synthase family protein [Panacagrimonas sp.]
MITGSFVELVTPLAADRAPDYAALEGLVDWHATEGSAALIVGTASSGAVDLDPETRAELLRRAVWQAEDRLAILADIGTPDVAAALEIAEIAADVGVSALLLTVPSTVDLTQADLLRHVERIAEDAALPLFVRNRFDRPSPPAAAGVAGLGRMQGIAGFVECSADASRARELLGIQRSPDFQLLVGIDELACRLVLDGFSGAVSVTANIAPGPVSRMIAAARAGDIAGAESIDMSLRPLYPMLLGDAGGPAVRWALSELGRLPEHPSRSLRTGDYADLRRAMRAAQILG